MSGNANEAAQLAQLAKWGIPTEVQTRAFKQGWTPARFIAEVHKMLDSGMASERYLLENLQEFHPELFGGYPEAPEDDVQPRKAKRASEFGDSKKSFLWYPFLPIGEYTVLMADGGTGKGILCCGISAAVTKGNPLPGDDNPREPGTVLFISAEDDGEDFKDRLRKSGADLDRCLILDRSDSVGMSIADRYEEFQKTVEAYSPDLIVLDPWHGFLGADVDISRVNAIRPILQKLSLLARQQNAAIIAVSHVNKRSQGENANNAATGSTDFVNAARSAMRLIFDEDDPSLLRRILVHTKSNFAIYGKSQAFRIDDGGLVWDGESEITKLTLEAAARNRKSVGEQIAQAHQKDDMQRKLIEALMDAAKGTETCSKRFTYQEFKMLYGDDVFGESQPKRALDAVIPALKARGIDMMTGLNSTRNDKRVTCFAIGIDPNTLQ